MYACAAHSVHTTIGDCAAVTRPGASRELYSSKQPFVNQSHLTLINPSFSFIIRKQNLVSIFDAAPRRGGATALQVMLDGVGLVLRRNCMTQAAGVTSTHV